MSRPERDALAEQMANAMFVLGVTSPNRATWPLDEDYRQSLARNLIAMLPGWRPPTEPTAEHRWVDESPVDGWNCADCGHPGPPTAERAGDTGQRCESCGAFGPLTKAALAVDALIVRVAGFGTSWDRGYMQGVKDSAYEVRELRGTLAAERAGDADQRPPADAQEGGGENSTPPGEPGAVPDGNTRTPDEWPERQPSTPHRAGDADDMAAEVDRLRARIEKLADLAAEHIACSGCPTPWWLTNWLAATSEPQP